MKDRLSLCSGWVLGVERDLVDAGTILGDDIDRGGCTLHTYDKSSQ